IPLLLVTADETAHTQTALGSNRCLSPASYRGLLRDESHCGEQHRANDCPTCRTLGRATLPRSRAAECGLTCDCGSAGASPIQDTFSSMSDLQFETPENVSVSYITAGLGTRYVAWFVDQILVWVVTLGLVIGLACAGVSLAGVDELLRESADNEGNVFLLYMVG